MRIYSFFILIPALSLSLSACEASFGDKYTIENFEIYYTDNVHSNYVERTAAYFKEHGLIQDEKHSAQLSFDESSSTFKLKLILNKHYKKLPADMIDDLLLLEDDMRSVIFEDLNFNLIVCDEQFNPVES